MLYKFSGGSPSRWSSIGPLGEEDNGEPGRGLCGSDPATEVWKETASSVPDEGRHWWILSSAVPLVNGVIGLCRSILVSCWWSFRNSTSRFPCGPQSTPRGRGWGLFRECRDLEPAIDGRCLRLDILSDDPHSAPTLLKMSRSLVQMSLSRADRCVAEDPERCLWVTISSFFLLEQMTESWGVRGGWFYTWTGILGKV